MICNAVVYLSRAMCLILVLATGMSCIAFANHDGSHGSQCIDSNPGEPSAPHHHFDVQQTAADPEAKERSCGQPSCVAVVASISIDAWAQRLASDKPAVRGDRLRASWSVESLHRPPIV